MKLRLLVLVGLTAGLLFLAANESTAGSVSWSISVFDGPLAACGQWVERPVYGRCWHPAYVASDWRPYCDGYWMWTDCGWYWVSDEPWAWACYHYGRWVYDSYYGWIWVPDTEWGPSWVCWREGGGYVGWAPLPPGSGFAPAGYWREPVVADQFFVFVGINHFAEPIHRRTVIVNNTTIINQTVNVTKIRRVNNVVVNNGPDVRTLEKVSARKLTVPPTRVVGRPEIVRPGEPAPRTLKSVPEQQFRQPAKEGKRESEIIRGPPSEPERPSVENPERAQKKQVGPQGMLYPWRNFEPGGPRYFGPVEPDSIQPRQRMYRQEIQQTRPAHNERGAIERRGQLRPEEGNQERQKKGERGGN